LAISTLGWRCHFCLWDSGRHAESEGSMIYTRISYNVVFLIPTIAVSVVDEFWIEAAWLGFAIGLKEKT
jgi:hypothetical protein